METKQECLSNHTLTASGRQVLALSRPHFGPDGELQYVPTYSWDEEELYTLLEKFDQERDNVRNVIRFMQGTDKTPSMIIAESDAMVKLLEYADHVAAVDSTVIPVSYTHLLPGYPNTGPRLSGVAGSLCSVRVG